MHTCVIMSWSDQRFLDLYVRDNYDNWVGCNDRQAYHTVLYHPLLPAATDRCRSVYCHWHQTIVYLIETLATNLTASDSTSIMSDIIYAVCKNVATNCMFTEIISYYRQSLISCPSFGTSKLLPLAYIEALKIHLIAW